MAPLRVSLAWGSAALTTALLGGLLIAPAPAHGGLLDGVLTDELDVAAERLEAASDDLPVDRYPNETGASGNWLRTGPAPWTSGFFPGSLWLMYGHTGDSAWRADAEARQAGLEAQKKNTANHNLGFKIFETFGTGYLLTGEDRYRRVVVRASRSLASRFNPAVGAINADGPLKDETCPTRIDNAMNLELLLWAASHGGNPAWYAMALSHARRTLKDLMRPDGSTFHVVEYDADSGRVTRKRTAQGAARSSTWARGQAWAIHGLTTVAGESRDPDVLAGAEEAADWFLDHLPADDVPYWDFDAPGIPDEPRDSSAGAIAASGLLQLAALESDLDPLRSQAYDARAEEILAALSSEEYMPAVPEGDSILLHGTHHRPHGNFDTGLVYGDHYFIEGLLRRDDPETPPAHAPLAVDAPADRNKLPAVLERGVEATVTTTPGSLVKAALLLDRDTARRIGASRAASGILGDGELEIDSSGEGTLTVQLDRRAKRQLRDLPKADVSVSTIARTPGGERAADVLDLRLGR
jgi:unsaturated chondroitin disaccharide hydrolase